MKKEITYVTCDLNDCHATDAKEVRFSAFGGDYAIDLCQLHHDTLVELLRPFAEHGRKAKRMAVSVRRDMPKATPAPEPTKRKNNRHKAIKAETESETNG